MKPPLNKAELNKLRSLVRASYGEHYTSSNIAKMDERGLADVRLTRFDNLDAIKQISDFPMHWLELEIQKDSKAKEVAKSIDVLLANQKSHLETFMVNNILDLTAPNKIRHVDVVEPQSLGGFERLKWVVFNRVLVTDSHLKALAANETLEKIDIRQTDVSRRGLAALKNCPNLEFLLVSQCSQIKPSDTEWLSSRLAKSVKVRIR